MSRLTLLFVQIINICIGVLIKLCSIIIVPDFKNWTLFFTQIYWYIYYITWFLVPNVFLLVISAKVSIILQFFIFLNVKSAYEKTLEYYIIVSKKWCVCRPPSLSLDQRYSTLRMFWVSITIYFRNMFNNLNFMTDLVGLEDG